MKQAYFSWPFYIVICWPLLLAANFAPPGVFKRVIGFRGMKLGESLIGKPPTQSKI